MRTFGAAILFSLVIPSFAQSRCEQQIVVNVRDRHGEFVPKLVASSFKLTVAGVDADASSANISSGINRVVVVLDASGSMGASQAFWAATNTLAQKVVASAPTTTDLGLVILSENSPRAINFGLPRKELIAAIQQFKVAKGKTALWDSLMTAAAMFGDAKPGDAVVLISDGGDNLSRTSPDTVERTFRTKKIRMFLMGVHGSLFPLGGLLVRGEEERVGSESLANMAKESGGDTSFDVSRFRTDLKTSDPSLVLKIAAQFLDEASHYYVVHLTAKPEILKPKRLNISVVTTDDLPRKGVRATYPQQLLPCGY